MRVLAVLALLAVGCGEIESADMGGLGGAMITQAGTGGTSEPYPYVRDPAQDCEGVYTTGIACQYPGRSVNASGSLCAFCTFRDGNEVPGNGCAVHKESLAMGVRHDLFCVGDPTQCNDCMLQ